MLNGSQSAAQGFLLFGVTRMVRTVEYRELSGVRLRVVDVRHFVTRTSAPPKRFGKGRVSGTLGKGGSVTCRYSKHVNTRVASNGLS